MTTTTALPAAAPSASLPLDATGLTVRQLQLDLSQGFERQWHRNAFLSQFYNALSMSFPVGEQSFMDSLKGALPLLPAPASGQADPHALLRASVVQFVGQEATHRHVHHLYNAQLQRQGLVNHWERWLQERLLDGQRRNLHPLHWLAITTAYEHFTAVLADTLLRHDDSLQGADPRLQTLWSWHAAEETEHRAVAFELYLAAGGNNTWRVRWYVYVLARLTMDISRQTIINLWHDGSLFKPSTWWDGASFLLGRRGLVWRCTGALMHYFKRDFHPDQERQTEPSQQSQALAQRWLAEHANSFRVIR